jgi:hypothetical protein
MKNFVIAAVLALTGTQAFAVQLVVCEGKIADQDVTFIDDGEVVGIHKGKVDIAAGERGNTAPFEYFGGDEISFVDPGGELCTMTVQSDRGSFVLEAPCNVTGPGKLKNLNIEQLQLVSAEVAVTCRREEYRRN